VAMKSQPNLKTPAGSDQGFTLAELLVGMAISALVMTAIYATFKTQHETYLLQELVASAQQNLRAGMLFMEREIRMAGCDPLRSADAEISVANANSISFTLDYTGGGVGGAFPNGVSTDANEDITYELDDDDNLMRTAGGSTDMIAENIGALNFVYLNDNSPPTVAANIASIRSVQISMVALADRGMPGYVYTRTHSNQQGTVIYGPVTNNINSRAMTVTINARNLGL
jgi:type IV pilus assembly protein PilW